MTRDRDEWDAVRAKLAEEALLRAADPVPHARTAHVAAILGGECAGFITCREQLRAVRARGEPAYDATDLADAERC